MPARQKTLFKNEAHGWKLTFVPAGSVLTCRHLKTRAVFSGTLNFVQSANGKEFAWTITTAKDGMLQRLSLIDPQGDVQGYVTVVAAPNRIELRFVHRPFASCHGVLTFVGAAQIGAATFACRTSPKTDSPVVQMASGLADSTLNDALFAANNDTLLHFNAAAVQITHDAKSTRMPKFILRMTARQDTANHSALAFEIHDHFYRSRYVPRYRPIDRKRCPSPPTGWMSWNVYFDQAGERENLDEARIGARYLRPFGLEIWSIESWQANSDKQPVGEFYNLTLEPHPRQFPHGMKWLAKQIKTLGFKPGIWTVPFGTGDHEFYQSHKDWFLHDSQGKPMKNWCGLYVLDPSQSRVRRHMCNTHRIMAQGWGYEFFKIDGMSCSDSGYSAHFFERPDVQAAFRDRCDQPYALCVKALRDGLGRDRIFLACGGHSTGPETALADAARIGGDIVHPGKPPAWQGLISQAGATLRQLFVHNLIWYNDPDALMVGERPADAARVATAIVALPGQVTFSSDKLGKLPPDRMRLIQQALPVCDVHPLDLFPIFELKPIWDLKISRPFAAWDVVSLFNWTDQDALLEFSFTDLGLTAEGKYLLFEFWEQKFLGEFANRFSTTVAPRSSLLLAVHPGLGRPQFLSTDRHVTQGGTCLRALHWDETRRVLGGATELVSDHPHKLFFHVPDGFKCTSVKAHDAHVAFQDINDHLLSVTLQRRKSGIVDWQILF